MQAFLAPIGFFGSTFWARTKSSLASESSLSFDLNWFLKSWESDMLWERLSANS